MVQFGRQLKRRSSTTLIVGIVITLILLAAGLIALSAA